MSEEDQSSDVQACVSAKQVDKLLPAADAEENDPQMTKSISKRESYDDNSDDDNSDEHDDEDEDEDEDEDDDDEKDQVQVVDRYWPPPNEESVRFKGSANGKIVSALAFDHSGSKLATGGHDHEVKIWDLEAINKVRPIPISTSHPSGGAVINHLEFSPDDELILVISGTCQAVLMARDGIVDQKEGVCAKGDQYISDMANTKGHVQMLNDGCWRPKDNSEFITCSNDGTVRVWNTFKLNQQKTVIKTRSPAGGLKTVANVCKYSRDGLTIAAGCQDGSVLMWDTRRKFISTSNCIRNAHLKGSEISGLDYSYDMSKLCTRSEDETCKIWDLRQLKKALACRSGLSTIYSSTDCCFSPDDRFIMTGTSGSKQKAGEVVFMDSTSNNLETRSEIELGSSSSAGASVLRVRWHPKINHLAYTSSDGQVYVTYDSRRSLGGGFMKLASSSSSSRVEDQSGIWKRKKFAYEAIVVGRTSSAANLTSSRQAIKKIITPHALPLFRDDSSSMATAAAVASTSAATTTTTTSNSSRGSKSGKSGSSTAPGKRHEQPNRSYKPKVPKSASQGGSSAREAGSTLSSYIAKSIAKP